MKERWVQYIHDLYKDEKRGIRPDYVGDDGPSITQDECFNIRTISLMSHVMKALLKIILDSNEKKLEAEMSINLDSNQEKVPEKEYLV